MEKESRVQTKRSENIKRNTFCQQDHFQEKSFEFSLQTIIIFQGRNASTRQLFTQFGTDSFETLRWQNVVQECFPVGRYKDRISKNELVVE